MIDSGLDEDVILSTLKDIGLEDSEIEGVLKAAGLHDEAEGKEAGENQGESGVESEVESGVESGVEGEQEGVGGGESPAPEAPQKPVMIGKKAGLGADFSVSRHADESGLHHSMTHSSLDEQSTKLESVQDSVQALHKKLDFIREQASVPTPELVAKVNAMKERLESFEADIKEIKAMNSALMDLLKKILETDSNVLSFLKK